MSTSALIAVFEEARQLLSRSENDFSWSSWKDADHALREIDEILASLRSGVSPKLSQIEILFAPTGPMQEVALSSGWGDEFLALSSRFDAATT